MYIKHTLKMGLTITTNFKPNQNLFEFKRQTVISSLLDVVISSRIEQSTEKENGIFCYLTNIDPKLK